MRDTDGDIFGEFPSTGLKVHEYETLAKDLVSDAKVDNAYDFGKFLQATSDFKQNEADLTVRADLKEENVPSAIMQLEKDSPNSLLASQTKDEQSIYLFDKAGDIAAFDQEGKQLTREQFNEFNSLNNFLNDKAFIEP